MPCCLVAQQILFPRRGPRGRGIRTSGPSIGEEVDSLWEELSDKVGLGGVADKRPGEYPTEKTSVSARESLTPLEWRFRQATRILSHCGFCGQPLLCRKGVATAWGRGPRGPFGLASYTHIWWYPQRKIFRKL